MSDITLHCIWCRNKLVIDDSAAGVNVACPLCAKDITIPNPLRFAALNRELFSIIRVNNPATARAEIRRRLRELGYSPSESEHDTPLDLSSEERINLIIDTNEKLANAEIYKLQGGCETLLVTRPAWELYRDEDRVTKRDWIERFRLAGQMSGRDFGNGWIVTDKQEMVALKNHPIWDILGDSDVFPDALDVNHPPFAFGSGMWVRDVECERCSELKIITVGGQSVQTRRKNPEPLVTIEDARLTEYLWSAKQVCDHCGNEKERRAISTCLECFETICSDCKTAGCAEAEQQ